MLLILYAVFFLFFSACVFPVASHSIMLFFLPCFRPSKTQNASNDEDKRAQKVVSNKLRINFSEFRNCIKDKQCEMAAPNIHEILRLSWKFDSIPVGDNSRVVCFFCCIYSIHLTYSKQMHEQANRRTGTAKDKLNTDENWFLWGRTIALRFRLKFFHQITINLADEHSVFFFCFLCFKCKSLSQTIQKSSQIMPKVHVQCDFDAVLLDYAFISSIVDWYGL